MITKDKWLKLRARMELLAIKEADIRESFIIGSGSGGQKLHKTASCVRLKYLPLKIDLKCQHDRSRENNRYFARSILCDKVDALINQVQSKQQQEREKIRRQKRRRSRRAQEKVLSNKKQRGLAKALRRKPDE